MIQVSISQQGQNIFLFSERSRMVKDPPGFLFSGYQGAFHWWEKQPSHEVQHPFAPHAQVKSEWSYTPSYPICLHVVDRDKFTFITELCHVTVLINNATFHTPALSPNSSAFHTSPPPTTSLCRKPPCHLIIAPPLPLAVYPSHPYLSSGAATCLRQVDPEVDRQHSITLQKTQSVATQLSEPHMSQSATPCHK